MGIDCDTYRARIGSFYSIIQKIVFKKSKTSAKCIGKVNPFLASVFVFLLLEILLIRAGIEPNPGPKKENVCKEIRVSGGCSSDQCKTRHLQEDPIHYHDYKSRLVFMYDQRSGTVSHKNITLPKLLTKKEFVECKKNSIKEIILSKQKQKHRRFHSYKYNQVNSQLHLFLENLISRREAVFNICNLSHSKKSVIVGYVICSSITSLCILNGEAWRINLAHDQDGVPCCSFTLNLDKSTFQWQQLFELHSSKSFNILQLSCAHWRLPLYLTERKVTNKKNRKKYTILLKELYQQPLQTRTCEKRRSLTNSKSVILYEWDTVQVFYLFEHEADTYSPFLNSTSRKIYWDFDQGMFDLDAEFLEAKNTVIHLLLNQSRKEYTLESGCEAIISIESSADGNLIEPLSLKQISEDDEEDSGFDDESLESDASFTYDTDEDHSYLDENVSLTTDTDEDQNYLDEDDETVPKHLYIENNSNYKDIVLSYDDNDFDTDLPEFSQNSWDRETDYFKDHKWMFKAINFRIGVEVNSKDSEYIRKQSFPAEKGFFNSDSDIEKEKHIVLSELDSGYASSGCKSILSSSVTSIEATSYWKELLKKNWGDKNSLNGPDSIKTKTKNAKPLITEVPKRRHETNAEYEGQLSVGYESLYSKDRGDNSQTPFTALISNKKDENETEWYFMFVRNTISGQKVSLYDFHNFLEEKEYSLCDLTYRQSNEGRSAYIFSLLDRWGLFDINAVSIYPVEVIACPATSLEDYFHQMQEQRNLTIMQTMRFEWMRVRSFWSFPRNTGMFSLHLARNGFFYTGRTSETQCYSCGQTYKEWTEEDDPEEVHRRMDPYCRHLRELDNRNVSIYPGIAVQWPAVQWQLSPAIGAATISGEIEEATGGGETEGATGGGAIETATGDENEVSKQEDITYDCKSKRQESRSIDKVTEKSSLTASSPKAKDAQTDLVESESHGKAEGSHQIQDASNESTNVNVIGLQDQALALPTNMAAPQIETLTRTANFSGQAQPTENSTERPQSLPGHRTQIPENTRPHPGAGRGSTFNSFTSDPMGINFERPRYPAYSVLTIRMGTFQTNWPAHLTQTPRDMASAGFFFAGYGDYCRCFFCGGGLRNWEPGDDPWVEHARWFPRCTFVIQNKGKRFVDLVVQRHQQRNQSQRSQRQQNQQEQPQQQQQRQQETDIGYQQPPPQRTHGSGVAGATSARQTPRVDKEKEELNLPAVISVRDMGYNITQIKSAIQKWKSRQSGQYNTSDMIAEQLLRILMDLEEEEESRIGSSPPAIPDNQPSEQSDPEKTVVVDHAGDATVMDSSRHGTDERDETSIGENGNGTTSGDQTLVHNSDCVESNTNQSQETDQESALQDEQEILALQQENEELRSQLLCTVCEENPVGVAFLPCGHIVCCLDCAPAMVHCPNCHEYIKGTVKAFLQ